MFKKNIVPFVPLFHPRRTGLTGLTMASDASRLPPQRDGMVWRCPAKAFQMYHDIDDNRPRPLKVRLFNTYLRALDGWEGSVVKIKGYGCCRGYIRLQNVTEM